MQTALNPTFKSILNICNSPLKTKNSWHLLDTMCPALSQTSDTFHSFNPHNDYTAHLTEKLGTFRKVAQLVRNRAGI